MGFPGSTGAYASSIAYHPNGMVNQVVHANTPSFPSTWLTDTYALDPFGMNRPASITTTTSGGAQRWATGTYGFDGAGNISSMGTHTFGYDKVSRLTAANLYLEPTSSTSLRFQTFSYDAQGNVTAWNGSQYEYDPFNLMWHYRTATAGDEWVYLYSADDERVWSYKADNTSLWTLRAPGANVLREYTTNGAWSVQSDYVYREGLLLAAETASGLRHFHLDHLGTPRLVTNSTGLQAAYHVYYPYGEEATAFNQDTIRAKFTGHERDLGNPGGSGDDLDYMHARFCSPLTGRFWSTDKANTLSLQVGDEEDQRRFREFLAQPQSWNRYTYTRGNPLKYVDPNGESAELAVGSAFAFGGGAGGASLGSLAAANPVGAVVLVGVGGALLGTAINKIPGVSDAIQAGMGGILDAIYMSGTNKTTLKVTNGLIAAAAIELGKIAAAGGPEKDPAGKHHQKEIKAILERAVKLAKRLPGKLKNQALQKIYEIAEQAGVALK